MKWVLEKALERETRVATPFFEQQPAREYNGILKYTCCIACLILVLYSTFYNSVLHGWDRVNSDIHRRVVVPCSR